MNVDELFVETGECGKYQVLQYFLLAFPIIFSSYQTITYIFSTGIPDYRCLVPECENETESPKFSPPWLRSAVPMEAESGSGHPAQCMRFRPLMNCTDGGLVDRCTADLFDHSDPIRCHQFVFREHERTVASEFKILCPENEWKIALVGTTNYLGFLIGMPIAGVLSDSYGRKTILIVSCFLQSLIGVLRSFSQDYEVYLLLQFMGAFFCGAYNAGFILALEAVGPSKRVLGNAIICCFHSLGEANVAFTMWILKDWRWMSQVLFGPGLLSLAYYWLVPESVRWLITKGNVEEATDVFKRMAKINGRELSPEFESRVEAMSTSNQLPQPPAKEMIQIKDIEVRNSSVGSIDNTKRRNSVRKQTSASMKEILKSHTLMFRIFCAVFCWCIITMVFFGLALRSVTVAGNKYKNFIMTVLLGEVPGYIATYILMDVKQVGRRPSLYLSLGLTGVTCLLFHVCRDYATLQFLLMLIGKFSITFAFAVIYIFTAEMFPTELRNSLLGICSMFGHVGSMLAPQTAFLAKPLDPMYVWGTTALIAAGLSFLFPETINARLPDTIGEAEKLGTKSNTK
ncbi:solute carrier family 22 member 21 isoform X2 [Nilaparvata lugens]|nr:solute carrier family 22 member 21 isoform X2 [Nilaparvata lugens]XP_039289004.1 solute carrier family 22 member 21 isoform X2 [Nilaparvata lugens]